MKRYFDTEPKRYIYIANAMRIVENYFEPSFDNNAEEIVGDLFTKASKSRKQLERIWAKEDETKK